jgi:multimeric flavodoxin WrbA
MSVKNNINVLGLHLSPRTDGTSWHLLEHFKRGVQETEAKFTVLSVAEFSRISGCQECGSCYLDGECAIRDDMEVFYRALERANRVVVATSLFFYDVPAQGKAVIDRAQAFWSRRYRLGQHKDGRPGVKGFLLAVGATKGKDLFTPVSLSVKYFFDALAYPKDFGTLFYRSVEEPNQLSQEQIRAAKEAGYHFALA